MNSIGNLYASIFSKGILSKVNNRLLGWALRARGYNNFHNNNESGETYFIKEILAPTQPKLCIDIGANVGGYTWELLQSTSAKVISFEPLPTAFEQLVKKTKPFSERVTVENMGVGATNDELTIHYNPDALAHASFSEDVKKVSYISNEKKTKVPVISLDLYCSTHNIHEVDLIKIDTEGFEAEVFEGARRVFSELKPKFVQIEFNWHQMFRNTSLNYFSELLPEYEVYQLVPYGWVKRDPKDPLTNIYHFSNFVFVHSN